MLQKHKLRSLYSRAVHGNVIAIIDHDGATGTRFVVTVPAGHSPTAAP
jgi:hypothetical protein